ncbi:MAG: TRAP transporter small permease [Rhizobiaceae bacterium]|nr:TRAP transporter small permease [Rhizobiaceae bacterium]
MSRIYDRLINGLAGSAAVALGLMVFGIVVDVVLRNTGYRPIQATSALIEYGMLYATMAGAPWLVREHGHVAIHSFVSAMPDRLSVVVKVLVLALSSLVVALLAWRSVVVALENVASNSADIRSIYIPGWVLFAMLAMGLGLMAIEFIRLVWRREFDAGSNAKH